MKPRFQFVSGLALLAATLMATWMTMAPSRAADVDPEATAIKIAGEVFVKAFNAGKVDELLVLFMPQGEIVDEFGVAHQGNAALQKLFTGFFTRYPNATLSIETDSIRVIGSLAIEEGSRHLATKDDAHAQVRYITMWTKSNGKWLIASSREAYDDPAPAPADPLAALEFFAGDWVSENSDSAVKLAYRWDDEGKFLLGEFQSQREGKPLTKCSQRIGWDPIVGKLRSWVFDADGGFSEACWTPTETGWLIKSSATLPEGATGSATLTLTIKDNDHFTIKGTERLVGDERIEDFEITVTRAPPAPQSDAEAGQLPATKLPEPPQAPVAPPMPVNPGKPAVPAVPQLKAPAAPKVPATPQSLTIPKTSALPQRASEGK